MQARRSIRQSGLVYEDSARYDWWLRLVLFGVPVLLLTSGLLLFYSSPADAWPMFALAVFMTLLFGSIMPRRYRVYQDGISIVLGGPFHIDIAFANIKSIQPASRTGRVFNFGVSFATSFRGVLEIRTKRSMNYLIAPGHNDQFMQVVKQEMSRSMKSKRTL